MVRLAGEPAGPGRFNLIRLLLLSNFRTGNLRI